MQRTGEGTRSRFETRLHPITLSKRQKTMNVHHHHHHHHHHRRGPIELLGRAAIGVVAAGTTLVVGAAAVTCAIVDDAINPRCRHHTCTTTQHLVVNVNAREIMTMSVVVPPGFHSGMSMPVHARDRIVHVVVPDYCAPGSVLYINA